MIGTISPLDLTRLLFSNLYTTLVVVAFFGLTIFVHELGHYLVARWCGLQINTFSIGFGPAIWKKEIGGIVYKVCWLPLGGYVALPQLDPNAMSTVQGDESGSGEAPLPYVAPWRKILVSLAGATGNVLFAIVLAWLVFLRGMPATVINQETVLGYVAPESAVHVAGVRTGDRILSVEGVVVEVWSQFVQEVAMHDTVRIELTRPDGSAYAVQIDTEPWLYGVQMVGGIEPREPVVIEEAEAGLSAALAGVQPGDTVISYAGIAVLGRAHMIDLVRLHAGEPQELVLLRGTGADAGEVRMMVDSAEDPVAGQPRIGIRFRMPEEQLDIGSRVHPRPMAQIRVHASAIFGFLRNLASPRTSARAARMVGGPVAIIVHYYSMVQASFMLAVWFTGFFNINLAIINLLPIPVLDGGHIMFCLWETVFRKPVHAKVVNALINVFAILLIGVFLLLTFRDVDRSPAGQKVRQWIEGEEQAVEMIEMDVPDAAVGPDGEPGFDGLD